MDAGGVELLGFLRVGGEKVAFGEEKRESTRVGADRFIFAAVMERGGFAFTQAMTSVLIEAGFLARFHFSGMVRERIEGFGEQDSQRLVAIERIEPNAGSAVAVVNVGADVQLEEIRGAGNFREERGANVVHEERGDSDVGFGTVSIDVKAGREGGLD